MLEGLTITVFQMGHDAFLGLNYVVVLLGAGMAALFLRAPKAPLARSWYYCYTSITLFLLAALGFVWVLYGPLVKLGVSFLVLLVSALAALAMGVFLAQINRARSLDAFGHGRRAWMGFVPPFNLVLLFQKSADAVGAPGSSIAGWAGLALMVLGTIVRTEVGQTLEASNAELAKDPEFNAIQLQGIDAAIDAQIAVENVPVQVAADLTLFAVTRGPGDQVIQYDYQFSDPDVTSLSEDGRRQILTFMCGRLLPLLKAGATGVLRFTRPDGTEIDSIYLYLYECTA